MARENSSGCSKILGFVALIFFALISSCSDKNDNKSTHKSTTNTTSSYSTINTSTTNYKTYPTTNSLKNTTPNNTPSYGSNNYKSSSKNSYDWYNDDPEPSEFYEYDNFEDYYDNYWDYYDDYSYDELKDMYEGKSLDVNKKQSVVVSESIIK